MTGYTAITLAVVSAATAAAGAISQGNAAKSAAEQNALVMERNAVISRQQGTAAAERQEREGRIRMGAARASAGGSGVTLDSFGDLLEDSAKQEELDRLTILYNSELQAQSGELSAAGERMAGDAAQSAGRLGAAGSLLSAAGSVAGKLPSSGGQTLTAGRKFSIPTTGRTQTAGPTGALGRV